MAAISLCMIVKNEEKVLARCLDSVLAVVDEIIIVDTGSTDATKSIAAGYTDKIYDFEWVDDFAAARNFSFSMATGDYLLWLDADDVLLPADKDTFLQLKAALDSQPKDVVMMRYNTAFDEEGKPSFFYYRERLLRRALPHRWRGRVHEYIECSGAVDYADIAVTHRSVKTVYSDRNLRIYEKQAAEDGVLSPRDQFYFARELYYHKQYARAEKMLYAYISDGNGWVGNQIDACKLLACCYTETEEHLKALEVLSLAFRFDTPRADVCCEIGNVLLRLQQYRQAVYWFDLALQLPRKEAKGAFVNEDYFGYLPCIQLCVCYDRLGNAVLAEAFNQRAGAYRPQSAAYLQNLQYFASLSQHKKADIE